MQRAMRTVLEWPQSHATNLHKKLKSQKPILGVTALSDNMRSAIIEVYYSFPTLFKI